MNLEFINTIIGSAALLMSSFTLFRDYLLPAKIKMFFGDSFQIVHADRNKIQINFNFTNSRNKLSVINKLAGILSSPNGNSYKYVWNIFYKLEGNSALPDRLPTSIAVLAKSSVFQGIEFISDERFTWVEGKHEFNIQGWADNGTSKTNNLSAKVIFSLSKDDVGYLNNSNMGGGTGIITPMRPIRITN